MKQKIVELDKLLLSEKIALFYFIATNIVLLAFANMVQEIEAIFDITILLLFPSKTSTFLTCDLTFVKPFNLFLC